MLEFLSPYDIDDAIVMLKADHEKVKDIFDKFEKAENRRQKKKLVAEAIMELKIHASIEEEIFYPTVRKVIGKKIMNEADEEHHVVKVLIAELEMMDGSEDHYDAKFKVLSENVRHHIREEERDMLPHSRTLDIDFTQLGKKMLARKQQLKKKGIATFGEEKMVAKSNNRSDSPARAAKLKKPSKTNRPKPSAKIMRMPKTLKAVTKAKPRAAAAAKHKKTKVAAKKMTPKHASSKRKIVRK